MEFLQFERALHLTPFKGEAIGFPSELSLRISWTPWTLSQVNYKAHVHTHTTPPTSLHGLKTRAKVLVGQRPV